MTYPSNYGLSHPGQSYSEPHAAIKCCGAWGHYLDSHWLVDTNFTAKEVWKTLSSQADSNDYFLIVAINRDCSGCRPQKGWVGINSSVNKIAA